MTLRTGDPLTTDRTDRRARRAITGGGLADALGNFHEAGWLASACGGQAVQAVQAAWTAKAACIDNHKP